MDSSMEALRSKANELFRVGKYQEAIDMYTQSIVAEPLSQTSAPSFANRSLASLRLELYGAALEDANMAIHLDSNYLKAYYRRAAAYMGMQRYKLALDDLRKVKVMQEKDRNPDKFIINKLKACEKLVRRAAFEKAISVEGRKEKQIAFEIDVESYNVDDDYKGPRLEDGKEVTAEFVKQLTQHFIDCKQLHIRYVLEILRQSYFYFLRQPSLVDIEINIGEDFHVVGDVHGQYFDLMTIFEDAGIPSNANRFLFNGDVVDRGSFSIECILLLLSYKLLYPTGLYISRGNHETHSMNQMYGFGGECKAKYSSQIYDFFCQVFQVFPLAHCLLGLNSSKTVVRKVLVMHGGLFSSDDVTLDDIRSIDRNRQPPHEGIMCEILWSDPVPVEGRIMSKRGIAIGFGPDVTENFCKLNDLAYIIRSHEVKQDGYEVAHDGKCITVFSAPNYCDTMGNDGAVVNLRAPMLSPQFHAFSAAPHPTMRPMQYAELANLL